MDKLKNILFIALGTAAVILAIPVFGFLFGAVLGIVAWPLKTPLAGVFILAIIIISYRIGATDGKSHRSPGRSR